MKICVIIDAWEPIWGGGQAHAWEISKRLVEYYGYSIDIFTRNIVVEGSNDYPMVEQYEKSKLRIFRVGSKQTVFSISGRSHWFHQVIRKIVSEHSKKPYTLLHAHAYISAIPGLLLRSLIRIPLVYTVHGSHLLDFGKRNISYFLEKNLLTQIRYDAEISVSKSFAKYPNVNHKLLYISNGVDVKKFDAVKASKRMSDTFIFLWVGRFDWTKGVDVLIKAFARLEKYWQGSRIIKLKLVGYGYQIKEFQALTNSLGLQKKIVFVGKKSGEELIREYKNADVFVLPSLAEGQAVTLFEAWAARLPVIASAAGDHAAIVKKGKNGYLVPAGNIDALFAAMKSVLENKKLKQIGLSGYLMTRKIYTWNNAAATQNRIYKMIVNNAKSK